MTEIWVDSHCHLDPEKEPVALAFFENARNAGVRAFLVQGTSLEDCEYTVALTGRFPGVYATAGLHPHVASTPYDMEMFRRLHTNPRVLAVGEIGLDYFYDISPREDQQRLFGEFLDLAVELGKPVVIHSRDAFEDSYRIVKEHLPSGHPFEIHSFSGSLPEMEKWLELGAMVSVNGMITFKKADNVRQLLHHIPLDRLLVETDSPYLAPVPLRGQENTPANIPLIGAKIAEERGLELADVARITTENAVRFFHIPEIN